jgi:hypothetical protein
MSVNKPQLLVMGAEARDKQSFMKKRIELLQHENNEYRKQLKLAEQHIALLRKAVCYFW